MTAKLPTFSEWVAHWGEVRLAERIAASQKSHRLKWEHRNDEITLAQVPAWELRLGVYWEEDVNEWHRRWAKCGGKLFEGRMIAATWDTIWEQLSDCYHHAEAVDWIRKWQDNGGQIFARNEMIALRNDPVWTRISAFHLPFPPFDLDSGMDVDVVPRNEAEKLGLISPNEQVKPIIIDLDFGAALSQRLAEYFSPEVQKQKLEIAMQQASASVLLSLARERLDSIEEITSESAPEIIMLLERALELGFVDDVRQQQATACGLLVDVLDSIEESDKAIFYRQQHLKSLEAWIAKGIPIDWNQLSNTYGLAAEICEKLNQSEQAIAYRQLQMENRDGFTLLSDTLAELKACGVEIEKEVGARILDNLTKAAERIPPRCF